MARIKDLTQMTEELNKWHDDAVILKERTQELALLINTFVCDHREQILRVENRSPGSDSRICNMLSRHANELEKEPMELLTSLVDYIASAKRQLEWAAEPDDRASPMIKWR